MSYTLSDIKLAAFNHQELSDLKPNESALWQGLAYCYDWFRLCPDKQAEECKQLAEKYIEFYWEGQSVKEMK